MLGPVVLGLTLLARRWRDEPDESWPHVNTGDRPNPGRLPVHKLVPWYIAGFLALAGARSLGLVPRPALEPIAFAASVLTVISMAALGLGTDIRAVAPAGASVTATVALSLLVLAAISFGLIRVLHIS